MESDFLATKQKPLQISILFIFVISNVMILTYWSKKKNITWLFTWFFCLFVFFFEPENTSPASSLEMSFPRNKYAICCIASPLIFSHFFLIFSARLRILLNARGKLIFKVCCGCSQLIWGLLKFFVNIL